MDGVGRFSEPFSDPEEYPSLLPYFDIGYCIFSVKHMRASSVGDGTWFVPWNACDKACQEYCMYVLLLTAVADNLPW